MENNREQQNLVRQLADILWQFHNDRLDDPSIKEMRLYINPVLTILDKQIVEAREDQTFKVIQSLVKSGSISDSAASTNLALHTAALNKPKEEK